MANEIKDIITFQEGTGLDSDSDLIFVSPGDSPVDPSVNSNGRLNIEYLDGAKGVVSNAKGNELETKGLPAGTNLIHGTCPDKENNAIIYFIQNSNDDDCIIRYKHDGTFENISYAEDWLFHADYPITKAGIIGDGNDAQLVWTDNYNEIRKINIYNFENAVYASIDEGNSYLAKPKPLKPSVAVGDDSTRELNNIRGKRFQFRYRYVYDTKEKSAWSQVSDIIYDYNDEGFGLAFSKNINLSNKITLTLTVGYDNIDNLEIGFRIGDVGGGVPSVWMLADIVTASTPTTTYVFYNDKNYSIIPTDVVNTNNQQILLNYHDVPQKALNLELLNDNRIAPCGVNKGYDLTTLNVILDAVRVNLGGATEVSLQPSVASSGGGSADITLSVASERMNILYVQENSVKTTNIDKFIMSSSHYKSTASDLVDAFVVLINKDKTLNITASNASGNLRITNNESYDVTITLKQIPIGSFTEIKQTMKSGAYAYFGIRYEDKFGRNMGVHISDATKIYIPFQTEIEGILGAGTYYDHYINGVKYTIIHLPPSGAVKYQWVYGGNNIEYFYQLPIVIGTATNSYEFDSIDIELVDVNYHIDINKALDRCREENVNNSRIQTFDPKIGDRVRFIGFSYNAYNHYTVKLFNETMDLEIIDIDSSGRIVVNGLEIFDNSSYLLSQEDDKVMLMEIYRPRKIGDAKNLIYHEVGDLLDISGGYHQASTVSDFGISATNQSLGVFAVGVINFGDVFKFASFYFFHEFFYPPGSDYYKAAYYNKSEHMNSSLMFESLVNSKGRQVIYDENFRNKTYNAIVLGGKYSDENLNYNELNKFHPKDIIYLDDKYGNVYGLEEKGYVLHALQQSKVTHIDIGRVSQSLPDGSTQYIATNAVLGSKRPSPSFYGTIFPFSIVNNNNYIYFYDIYAGDVVRISNAGVQSITQDKYKMYKYFTDKSNTLIASGISNISVYGGWDPVNNLYILTFIDSSNASNNETIAFHEPTQRWITFYSFKGYMYANIGENMFLSFTSAGVLYKHHSASADRNSFYGSGYSSKIKLVSNKHPELIKRFNSISEDSNVIWEAPNTDSIIINPNAIEHQDPYTYTKHHLKMQSEIVEELFRLDDGEFKAEFLRDNLTTTGSPTTVDLINGRALQGKVMSIQLENNDTTASYLKMVTIKSTIPK